MSYSVKVSKWDRPVTVEMGQTILEAALAQGVPYPHGCRSGNCGACKSDLLAGDVEMTPYSDYALSKPEKDQGLILACRSVPWSDCEVAWLEAEDIVVHANRKLTCTVAELEDATHDVKIMRLRIEAGGPFDFSAGQYSLVTFEGLPPRDYSMANKPGDPLLEFHIRLIPGGAVTPFVADELKAGDTVKVDGPYGTSYLRENHRGPIIAAAGGSGMAPIKSIVDTALAKGMEQAIYLYFGVRAERDLYLEGYFTKLTERHPGVRFIPVLSDPDGPTARRTGFLADAIAMDFDDLDGCKAYLAGPPIMVETTVESLKNLEVRRQDCHADAFYTEADREAQDMQRRQDQGAAS